MMIMFRIILYLYLVSTIKANCDKCVTNTGLLLECRGLKSDVSFAHSTTSDVTEIIFIENNFTTLSMNVLQPFQAIKSAVLIHDNIEIINRDSFKALKKMEELDLSTNKIESLKDYFFRNNGNLQRLILSHNKINYIEPSTFSSLEKLRFVDMSSNRLEILPAYLFYRNVRLIHINLSKNRLRYVEANIIQPGLVSTSINLYGNNYIGSVPKNLVNFVNGLKQSTNGNVEASEIEGTEESGIFYNDVEEWKNILSSIDIVEAIIITNATITICIFLYGAFNVLLLFYTDNKKKSISRNVINVKPSLFRKKSSKRRN